MAARHCVYSDEIVPGFRVSAMRAEFGGRAESVGKLNIRHLQRRRLSVERPFEIDLQPIERLLVAYGNLSLHFRNSPVDARALDHRAYKKFRYFLILVQFLFAFDVVVVIHDAFHSAGTK